jgi:hypothetical protein
MACIVQKAPLRARLQAYAYGHVHSHAATGVFTRVVTSVHQQMTGGGGSAERRKAEAQRERELEMLNHDLLEQHRRSLLVTEAARDGEKRIVAFFSRHGGRPRKLPVQDRMFDMDEMLLSIGKQRAADSQAAAAKEAQAAKKRDLTERVRRLPGFEPTARPWTRSVRRRRRRLGIAIDIAAARHCARVRGGTSSWTITPSFPAASIWPRSRRWGRRSSCSFC